MAAIIDNPTSLHFIVAHSHGGMVALYALRDQALAAKIDGLITLSTPFLVRRDRNLSIVGTFAVGAVTRLLPAALAWVVSTILFPGSYTAYFLLAGLTLIGFVVIADIYYPRSADWLSATLDLARLRENQLYVVRGPADEAYALLLATQFFQWIISSVWGRQGLVHSAVTNGFSFIGKNVAWFSNFKFGRALPFSVFGFWITYGLLWHYDLVAPLEYFIPPLNVFDFAAPLGPKVYYLFFATVLFVACAVPLAGAALLILVVVFGCIVLPIALLASMVLMLPIAAELGPFSASLDISVEPLPPGQCVVKQIEAQSQSLLHSVTYKHPEALQAMTTWMLQKKSETPSAG
jgi:hypothetical protein